MCDRRELETERLKQLKNDFENQMRIVLSLVDEHKLRQTDVQGDPFN